MARTRNFVIMKAREVESELSKKLLDETTPEELEKINRDMNNQTQKTALYNFIKQLELKGEAWENNFTHRIQISIDVDDYRKLKKQCEEIEKEQHGKTWDNAIQAHEQRGHVKSRSICDFDEYYNKTYGGNK